MMDAYSAEAHRSISGQEGSNEDACRDTASKNGHSITEADLCEAGSVGCQDCPFRKER